MIVDKAEFVFRSYNLAINTSKTELTEYNKEKISPGALRNTKKLRTILDEQSELARRKALSNLSLFNFKKL